MLKLNLGCGNDYRPGWINADLRPELEPDVLLDMDVSCLPFEDNTFERVLADNVLEHSSGPFDLLEELHRITTTGAVLTFRGPHWNSMGAWTDPTHTRPFTRETFDHYLLDDLFEIQDVSCTRIRFGRLLPESLALVLADHVGDVVAEIEVEVRRT